jgi:hypothetical protein
LEPDVSYRVTWVDPANGNEYTRTPVTADADGRARPQAPPRFQDWVLILDRDRDGE